VQSGLALVGEVEVAGAIEDEVVDALEALAVAPVEQRRHAAGSHVDDLQPVAVVGDQQLPWCAPLQPVGLAVVLGDEAPLAVTVDAEDAAVLEVGDVEVARLVEHRSLEERVTGDAESVRLRPRAEDVPLPEAVGQLGEDLEGADLGFPERPKQLLT